MQDKQSNRISGEIFRMFRSLGTVPERLTPSLVIAPTKDVKMTLVKTKVVPESHEIITKAMLAPFKVGKQFVKKSIFYQDFVTVIDWDSFELTKSARNLVKETIKEPFTKSQDSDSNHLKECYIFS